MNNNIIYLAGPMSGLPDFNHAEFNRIAKRLRDAGRRVVNPAECDNGSTDKPWSYYMRHGLRGLLDCDEVLCLPGWEKSKGARLEVTVALALGMQVQEITGNHPDFGLLTNYVDELPPPAVEKAQPQPQETILQEADRLVSGDRQSSYGHPAQDFTRTGKLWAAILDLDTVTPEQVALCMVALKISRECHKPKRDNRVDGAGYFKCLDLVVQACEGGAK